MRESWNTFASNTTLHGLRYVFGASSWIRRLWWILCMLTATGCYINFLRLSFLKYISLPIGTRISYEFLENGIPFPAVTICNLDNLDKFKLDLGYHDENFKKYGLNLQACDAIRNISGNLTCGQALMCATFRFGPAVIDNCTWEIHRTLKKALQESRSFDPDEFAHRYGHDFNTMLTGRCEFSLRQTCTAKDFVPIVTRLGLCHTFNNHVNGTQKRIRFSGSAAGLRIALDAKGSRNTFGGGSIGFQVIIHNPTPFVHVDKGFHVPPGTNINALMQVKRYSRLPKPYKTACSMEHLGSFGNYTRESCITKCWNDVSVKECGCRIAGSPGPKDVPTCAFELETYDCSRKLLDKWNPANCSCSLPCKELRYYIFPSYSKYPSETLVRVLKNQFKVKQSEEYLRNNLVHLRIGFADNTYQVYSEFPSYGENSLFADIGGGMGLLMGCSILTLVEFFDYLCISIFSFLCTRKAAQENHQ